MSRKKVKREINDEEYIDNAFYPPKMDGVVSVQSRFNILKNNEWIDEAITNRVDNYLFLLEHSNLKFESNEHVDDSDLITVTFYESD